MATGNKNYGFRTTNSKIAKRKPTKKAVASHLVKSLCVRCRALNIACDHRTPRCSSCEKASVSCLYFQPTINDRLFSTIPQNPSLGNRNVNKSTLAGPNAWMRLSASDEFLKQDGSANDTTSDAHIPDDTSSITENPLREKSGSDALDLILAGPLQKAIDDYPEESANDPEAVRLSMAGVATSPPQQLPLPSSDILDCINRLVARKEASTSQVKHNSLNEQLNGSSLLALGILLQEHCRYLL
ncbi:hypothetical protein LPJ57_007772 [Coemansia sp. RSA 486]|nr:hypothetical protein LPJ57_007772 [Coemansia sp. RSA 486]